MAASSHFAAVMGSPSTCTTSSFSTHLPLWSITPTIMTAAILFAFIMSTVLSAAISKDAISTSDHLPGRFPLPEVASSSLVKSQLGQSGDGVIKEASAENPVPLTFFAENIRHINEFQVSSTHQTGLGSLPAPRSSAAAFSSRIKRKTYHGAERTRQREIHKSDYQNHPEKEPLRHSYHAPARIEADLKISSVYHDIFPWNISNYEGNGQSVTHTQRNNDILIHTHHFSEERALANHLSPKWKIPTLVSGFLTTAVIGSSNESRTETSYFDSLNKILSLASASSQKTNRHHRSLDQIDLQTNRSRALHQVRRLQTKPFCPSKRDNILLEFFKFKSEQFFSIFGNEVSQIVRLANIINDLLLFTKFSPEDFLDVFFAMTQSMVETGPQVTGCAIIFSLPNSTFSNSSSFSPNSSETQPHSLYPYSYRTHDGTVVVTDLSKVYNPQKTTWFGVHVNRSTDGLLKSRNRILANKTDIGKLNSYLGKWDRTVAVGPEDGYWTTPYYDCSLRNWIILYSVPFYQLVNTEPEFKGVVVLEANFETIQINQCAQDGSLFSDTHRCKRDTTQCKNIPRDGFSVGSYECTCKEGHVFPVPNAINQAFDGVLVEAAYMDYLENISSNYSSDFNCLLMQTSAPLNGDQRIPSNYMLRGIPLGIQSFCMTVSVVIGIVIVCLRKTKVMRSSVWLLLEMLLLGATLLYATVVVQYFEPSTTTCLLLPWLREVGFVIVYGVLILKIYRILAEFQSRKAHRVHVRDKDLFKYLAVILVVVIAYMSAWTAVNFDHLDNNSTILEWQNPKDQSFSYIMCRSMWWDYVIESGELLFLCCGMYMCYCVRSASTEYSEGRFITGAICYEALVSTSFYVLRHLQWYQMHPDHLFLMYFIRCQLTVTVVLFIILGPKLWYAHRPPDDDHSRSRAYSQSDVQDSSAPETMKLNVGISSNGDVEVGEISLTEMDPEDIRAELKRLYTQLQIYKTKTMRKDNPHISKRRGGRKQTHRRFSLQAFHHKHRHHHDHEHEHEMSKTPEESTNSAEAMAFTMEPIVKEELSEGRSVPSVSFKSGHK